MLPRNSSLLGSPIFAVPPKEWTRVGKVRDKESTDMEPENRAPKKKYEESFKKAAVDLLISSGKKPKQIANELGISTWNLRDWKKVYGPKMLVRRSATELETEVQELRRELMRVKTQRDILKKTLGILSTPEDKDSNGSKR